MWKEMDELKSAMKDNGGENLDGMSRRTDSPFTTEPSPPTKISSPIVGVVWQFQGSLESHQIIQDADAIADDPKQGDV